jgi:hypothetical protein
MARGKARTRVPGFENPKEQVVVRNTLLPGTDLHQYVDVLRCGECGHEYGSNNHNRKCPWCQKGKPGLPFE